MELGQTIPLDGSAPALRPCRKCGNKEGRVTAGVGPHYAGVRCQMCDLHLGWLPSPKRETESLIDDQDDGRRVLGG